MKALLGSVALIGLAAVVGAVVVGSMVFEGTVVSNPYERGIAWDKERARVLTSGLRAAVVSEGLRRGDESLVVGIYDSGGAVTDPWVDIRLLRPSTSEHDRVFRLHRRVDGLFEGEVHLPLPGRWLVDVVVERQGQPVELRLEIPVGG